MRWGIRCGNGGFFSFTGLFYNRKLGFHRAFVTDHIRTVVLRFPHRTVVVSPADPEAFVRDLAALSSQPSIKNQKKTMQTMNNKTLWIGLAIGAVCVALAVVLLTFLIGFGHHQLTVKAFIDASDVVKVSGNRLWFEHETGTLPGRNIFVNGKAWSPSWTNNVSTEFVGLNPAFWPHDPQKIQITKRAGRGTVSVAQFPSPANDETLAVRIDNVDFGGADWYEVVISWDGRTKSATATTTEETQTRTGVELVNSPSRITNAPSASAGTWSPKLASDEKPDLQKILSDAKDLMEQGKYEDSLQRQLWYFNHALEYDQGQTGVRLSFALSQWVELGRRYPKAKEALIEIRDHDTRALAEGKGYANLFTDVQAINRELQDEEATYALFKTIREKDPQLASQCYFWVESLLVAKGEYQWCYDHMGDPQSRFNLIRQSFDMDRANQQRMAETQQMIAEMNRKSGRTNVPSFSPPDTSAMMKKSAEDRFIGQVRQLIEILVATGHKSDAEKIRDQAVAILDDARLKSAVTDAEGKIRYKLVQNGKAAEKIANPVSPTNSTVADTNNNTGAAVAAAGTWLKLIDEGQYAESHRAAAKYFQGAVTETAWENSMETFRKPLGSLVSRSLKSAQPATELPGAPDGSYVVMQFDTSFTDKKVAVETVTFMLEKDGQWRAAGYFIK